LLHTEATINVLLT